MVPDMVSSGWGLGVILAEMQVPRHTSPISLSLLLEDQKILKFSMIYENILVAKLL